MNDEMNTIAPLDSLGKEKFFQPAYRIFEAKYKQQLLYHEHPVHPDLSTEYEAIAAWATVTCSYSGIEQAMKCLLQMRGAFKRKNHWHHCIGKLFRELASEEQDVLRASYAIYRSLHDYILPETVDCFLDAIDAGYITWRYFLLDGVMPPTTHPGAMLEVWSALTDILKARVFTNHGLNTVKQRIDFRLRELHKDAAQKECKDLEQINSIIRWRKSDTFVDINLYLDLLCREANGQPYSIGRPSITLPQILTMSPVLRRFVDKVKKDTADNDFVLFRCRAQRGDIVWNAGESKFEAR